MTEALRIGGRSVNHLCFADDINLIAGNMKELAELTERLDKSASAFGMEISAEKNKTMVTPATNENNTNIPITVNGSKLQSVKTFKHLGSNITEDGNLRLRSQDKTCHSHTVPFKTKDNLVQQEHLHENKDEPASISGHLNCSLRLQELDPYP